MSPSILLFRQGSVLMCWTNLFDPTVCATHTPAALRSALVSVMSLVLIASFKQFLHSIKLLWSTFLKEMPSMLSSVVILPFTSSMILYFWQQIILLHQREYLVHHSPMTPFLSVFSNAYSLAFSLSSPSSSFSSFSVLILHCIASSSTSDNHPFFLIALAWLYILCQ